MHSRIAREKVSPVTPVRGDPTREERDQNPVLERKGTFFGAKKEAPPLWEKAPRHCFGGSEDFSEKK